MTSQHPLIIQLTDVVTIGQQRLEALLQQMLAQLQVIDTDIRNIRLTTATASPFVFKIASVNVPASGQLAVNAETTFDILLEEGVRSALILALFVVATADTTFNIYLYDSSQRAQSDIIYADEDIVIPSAPLDGTRVLNTARVDLNPIPWPGILWRNRQSEPFVYGRLRNQNAGGGVTANAASFEVTVWYLPAG